MANRDNKKNKLASKQKHSKEAKLEFTKDQMRFATNELVADWRASRLKCDRIADIGCGIGLQSISFAKKCRHVVSIDLDSEKIKSAKKNITALHIKNADFYNLDCMSEESLSLAKDSEIIFLDPAREEFEDARKIVTIKPDIREFISKYSKITDKIAIEFPPQIKDLNLDCEREYVSVNGKLNRLTLYFGSLKNTTISAVCLPSKDVLQKDEQAEIKHSKEVLKYLYECDGGVQKAGLLAELSSKTEALLFKEQKYVFFTSKKAINSNFFRVTYIVLATCNFVYSDIIEKLKINNGGKVIIRYEVDPKDYWNVKNDFDKHLVGDKNLVLFKFDDLAVIAKEEKFN